MLCLFRISLLLQEIFLVSLITHSTAESSLERSLANITQSLCDKVSDSLFVKPSTTELQLTNDAFPTLPLNSNYSNAVSITTLSSSIINGFGDSYAIAIIGVGNDANIEWQSISPTGSALPLPDIIAPEFSNNNESSEVQYDNRFGLFHIDANFDSSFPIQILILAPTDRIRFKLLTNSLPISLDDCEAHALYFVFFKVTPYITTLLGYTQAGPKEIINIKNCEKWPFSNTIYKICPGYQIYSNVTMTKQNFSTLINKITEGVTIGSLSFDDDALTIAPLETTTKKEITTENLSLSSSTKHILRNATSPISSANPATTQKTTSEGLLSTLSDGEKTTSQSPPSISEINVVMASTNIPQTISKEVLTAKMLKTTAEDNAAGLSTSSGGLGSMKNMQQSSASSPISSKDLEDKKEITVTPNLKDQSIFKEGKITTNDNGAPSSTPSEGINKVATSQQSKSLSSLSMSATSNKEATIIPSTNVKTTKSQANFSVSTNTNAENLQPASTSSQFRSINQESTLASLLTNTEIMTDEATADLISSTIGKRSTLEPLLTSTVDKTKSNIISSKSLSTSSDTSYDPLVSTANKGSTSDTSASSFSIRSAASSLVTLPTDLASTMSSSLSPSSTRSPKICSTGTTDSNLCKYCTKDLISKQCVASIYPQLFDIGSGDEAKIMISLETSKDLDEIGKFECNLINRVSLQVIESKVEIDDSTITIEFKLPSEQTEMRLSCSVDGAEFLSNKTIYVSSFQLLVEHKTPFSSGFDSSVEYKTIYVTFKEALPSQFITTTGSNDSFCVLDQQLGTRYSAKLETPSVLSCNIEGSVAIGDHKLYAIRRPELESTTYQYQIPLSFSVTAASSTTSPNTKTAQFLPTLKGILVTFDSNTDITDRTFNCSKVFLSSETFGAFSICQMTGSELTITFGASPTILPNQPLLVRSGTLTNAYLDGARANVTQYDVIELEVPEDAVAPSITLQEPSEAIKCQENVNLSVSIISGDGARNLTYQWNLKSGGSSNLGSTLSQTSTSFFQIPLTDIGSSASISVNACNFAGKCSESNIIQIKTSDKTSQFTVSIAGIPSNPVPSLKIAMSSIANFVSCNSTQDLSMTNISYIWSINGSVVSYDSIYTLPAKTYPPNSVLMVSISAKYWNEETSALMESNSQQIIVYGIENLVGVVDGTDRAIASDTELIMDARQSYDPNTGSSNLTHSWSCALSDGTNCTNLGLNWSSKMLVVASGVLKPGKNYTFTDTISNSLGSVTHISINVNVLQGSVPIIQLIPLTEFSLPMDNYIRVQGYVQSKTELVTEWQLYKSPDSSVVDVSNVFPQAKRNFSENGDNSIVAVSFTIPPGNTSKFPNWKGLDPGKYNVRLVATNVAGSSFTDHVFEVLALPKKPTLSMTPLKDVSALQTTIQLSATDVTPSSSNKPMSLRFGFRILLVNNRSMEKWFRSSAMDYYKTVLAAAWPEPHAACDERVAYEGLLEICDFDGACSMTQSEPFVVQHPINSSAAVAQILTTAISDIASGDIDGALVKLEAIQSEQCNTSLDKAVVDALISKVLINLENSTDSDSLLAGVGICAAVISSASKENVNKVMELLIRAQKATMASMMTNNNRQKRSTATSLAALAASSVSAIPESSAETLLVAYDSLLKQNQNVLPAYIDSILELLSGFCVQADSTRVMTADGDSYTVIQAESLSPVDNTFLNQSYDVATVQNSIKFGKNFKAAYKSYQCGDNQQAICTDICLASADISKKALTDNSYLQQYFFGSTYNAITFVSAMSELYYVLFLDSRSGSEVTLPPGIGFNFSIPLSNYAAANYYSCFVYSDGIWRNNMCKSNDYAIKIDTTYVLQCYCEATGVIAAFTFSPPTPPYYPPYNAIELKFNLSSTTACTTAQYATFLGTLASSSAVAAERFQNFTCNNGTNFTTDPASIILQLRPPFRVGHLSNSFAMQAINRAVTVGSRMVAYGKIEVTGFKANTIFRALDGDGRARRVQLRIDQSFTNVVGNSTEAPAMAIKWATNLSKNMQVDPQRFKTPNIVAGIIFNITITLPFDGETSLSDPPLTAEELSLWVKEQTDFYEIDFRDNNDQRMQVDPMAFNEIVQLEALSPTNTLMTVLAIVLSTVFVLSSLCIGGLVFLKIRTDRLIDEHNRNIRTIQIDADSGPPMTVIPFESNGLMIDRNGLITEEMHDAADTVILGRHAPARVRHR